MTEAIGNRAENIYKANKVIATLDSETIGAIVQEKGVKPGDALSLLLKFFWKKNKAQNGDKEIQKLFVMRMI